MTGLFSMKLGFQARRSKTHVDLIQQLRRQLCGSDLKQRWYWWGSLPSPHLNLPPTPTFPPSFSSSHIYLCLTLCQVLKMKDVMKPQLYLSSRQGAPWGRHVDMRLD